MNVYKKLIFLTTFPPPLVNVVLERPLNTFFFFFLDMFFHIANIEREVYWQIGNVCCSAYPIEQLDTINSSTGELNTQSALNLIVFGVSSRLLYSSHARFVSSRKNKNQMIHLIIWFLVTLDEIKRAIILDRNKRNSGKKYPLNI